MHLLITACVLIVLSSFTPCFAQVSGGDSQCVILESITNAYHDTLVGGNRHFLNLRVRNLGSPMGSWYNYTNNFVIYSPDGASFGPILADTILNPSTPGVALLGRALSPLCGINYYGRDGQFRDTLTFFGLNVNPGFGLQSGFNQVAWRISFVSSLADSGKHICIDSTFSTFAGHILWSPGQSPTHLSVRPGWSGQRCFTISGQCCRGFTGNVDCDENDNDDIADLTRLVDFLFLSFEPLCCPGEADMNSDNGVDVADLTAQVDHMFVSFAPLPVCLGL